MLVDACNPKCDLKCCDLSVPLRWPAPRVRGRIAVELSQLLLIAVPRKVSTSSLISGRPIHQGQVGWVSGLHDRVNTKQSRTRPVVARQAGASAAGQPATSTGVNVYPREEPVRVRITLVPPPYPPPYHPRTWYARSRPVR